MSGGVGTVLAFALFVCTAMIYACLPFLREWHTPLTVINYMLLGGASGFTLAASCHFRCHLQHAGPGGFFAGWAFILTLLGLAGPQRLAVAQCAAAAEVDAANRDRHQASAHRAEVAGFMGGSFNTREFFHGKSPAFLRAIKPAFLVLAFGIPLLLLFISLSHPNAWLLAAAFVVQYAGLLAERWFFFAEANHPQNLYYQTIG